MLAQVISTQTTTINPLGYTYVRLDGSVDPAISRNVTSANVVRNDSGVYGFRNLPFIPRNIQIALAFRTQAVTNNGRGWEARRDMNATTDSNWWKTYRDEGYRLVNVEVYQTTQGRRYADVGRQNGDSLNWAAKKDVDNAIIAYKNKFDVPGLSVAIARDGKLLYARGFGFANLEQKKVAHSGTIFRLASVSKPVTNALTMRLVDQNRLSLDQATRFYVPDLPQQHTHTVRQLMTHQSGIRHYKGSKRANCEVPNNPNWKDSSGTQYPTATEATKLFRNDPLMFTPGEKTCYSTHAFTVLGAALEGASKVSFPALVNRELTQGLDLPTLRPEVLNQGNPERAAIYKKDANNKNVLSNRDNLSWKYPGGGLESSSVDLARFGMKILEGSFLSTQALNELGWQGGVRSFTGSQNGANSNLRFYPNSNLVIAILSNQNGHNPEELGQTLGNIVLKAE
jgi:CubicO group peptidase (beta-lactamase class C family)